MDWMYLGFRPVRRECVPGVATGRTLPVGALAWATCWQFAFVAQREEAAGMPRGETDGGTNDPCTEGPYAEGPALAPETLWLNRHYTADNLPQIRAQLEHTAAAAGLTGVRLGEF